MRLLEFPQSTIRPLPQLSDVLIQGLNTSKPEDKDEDERKGSIIVVPLRVYSRRKLWNLVIVQKQESKSMIVTESNLSHSSLSPMFKDPNFLKALREGVKNAPNTFYLILYLLIDYPHNTKASLPNQIFLKFHQLFKRHLRM